MKASERVKCQKQENQGGREKVSERDLAHVLVVIHSLTCGEHQ